MQYIIMRRISTEEEVFFRIWDLIPFTSAEYIEDENQKNSLAGPKDSVLTDEIVKCLRFYRRGLIMYILFPYRDMEIILQNRYWKIRRSQFPGAPTDELNNKMGVLCKSDP